jgi:hypothetical protein
MKRLMYTALTVLVVIFSIVIPAKRKNLAFRVEARFFHSIIENR